MIEISVIIPIYCVEQYIEKCVRSLFGQTINGIEYIFVDDNSTDKSLDILDSVIEDFPGENVRIIRHSANMGVAVARRTGLQYATGNYITFCDPDDWVESNAYELLLNTAIMTRADIVWCDYYKEYEEGASVKASDESSYMNHGIYLWNKLIKRELLENDRILMPQGNQAEDQFLVFQLLHLASAVHRLKMPLYHYCIRQKSLTTNKSGDNLLFRLEQIKKNIVTTEHFIRKEKIENQCKTELIWLKYIAKWQLTGLLSRREYRKMWRRLYSEINIPFLFSKLPLSAKVLFITRLLGFSYQKNRSRKVFRRQ